MRPLKYNKNKTPIFVEKLYDILMDPENKGIIEWTQDNNAFIVLDLGQFSQRILPRYFKHCNYNSFVRQLNMYDFNKARLCIDGVQSEHAFSHHLFSKNIVENMALIRRKDSHKCQPVLTYPDEQHSEEKSNDGETLYEKIVNIQKKQEKLQQFCFQLIRQNQVLLTQNQQLAHKVKKQSKKKQRILDQVFRIIGVSITEFWEEFCSDTQTLEQKTSNFKQIYKMLMTFIEKNDLPKILKTLEMLILPSGMDKKKKGKFFKVVNSSELNFLSSYTEQQVQQFINQTNILLQQQTKSKTSF